MKAKKILAGILAGLMTFGAYFVDTEAATRDEIAAVKVKKSGNFKYWNKNAEPVTALKNYVKDVTSRSSKNFIPVEDRIAVFDMDGTIFCETAPYYFDYMLFLHRTLDDKSYTPSAADRDFAVNIDRYIRTRDESYKKGSGSTHKASVFAGLTDSEFAAYVEDFMDTRVEGLTNLTYGESFYLPMVEVIKYLQANEFTVYIVSGCDRNIIRVLASDLLKVPVSNVIGSDVKILAKNQGDTDPLKYRYAADDYLIRGEFVTKDTQMNKVSGIAREIGKQPVLAFGNSSDDLSMLNYTVNGNKYKSLGFFVICDDLERELGDTAKAEKCVRLAQDNGWMCISMRDDFKTIYGDNVRRN